VFVTKEVKMTHITFAQAHSFHRAAWRRWLVLGLALALLLAGLVATMLADPETRSSRNRIAQTGVGQFQVDNGRHRATFDSAGIHFTPRVAGELRPSAALSARLTAVRSGNVVLYGGTNVTPALLDDFTAGYNRVGGLLREEHRSLDQGIDQVFVLPAPLSLAGDLIFVVQLTTQLTPSGPPTPGGGLHFPIDAAHNVTYGPAVAIDAQGRTRSVPMAYNDGEVTLTVPQAWLAAAAYPVEIDPLIGTNFFVSQASNNQVAPAAAYSEAAYDLFLVVWEDYRNGAGDADIYGQRVNAIATPVGDPIEIRRVSGSNQRAPAVAYDDTSGLDRYLVTWEEYNTGTRNYDIWVRFIRYDGFLYTPFAVSTAANNQLLTSVAYDANSQKYLVVWQDYRNGTANADVYGRIVNADGSLGSEVAIATSATSNAQKPDVAYNPIAQKFLIAWEDNRSGNWDIYGRGVDGQGNLTTEFAIATGALNQQRPTAAGNAWSNRYAVAWEEQSITWRLGIAQMPLGGPVDWTKTVGDALADRRDAELTYSKASSEWLLVWQRSTTTVEVQPVASNGDFVQQGKYTLNADTSDVQAPALAWNSGRNQYFGVWQGYNTAGETVIDVYGQLFSSDFFCCTNDRADVWPMVATNTESGEYLVTWEYDDPNFVDFMVLYEQFYSPAGAVLTRTAITTETLGTYCTDVYPMTALTYGNNQYFSAWTDIRPDGFWHAYGARIAANGTVLDAGSIPITTTAYAQIVSDVDFDPASPTDGSDDLYFAIWRHTDGQIMADECIQYPQQPEQAIRFDIRGGRVLASNGQVVDTFRITTIPGNVSHIGASVAFNSHTSYRDHLVVYAQREPATGSTATMSVRGQLVSGNQLGNSCTIFASASPAAAEELAVVPNVVYNPTRNEYAVVSWHAGQVKIQRVSPTCTLTGSAVTLPTPPTGVMPYPDIAYIPGLEQYVVSYEMADPAGGAPAGAPAIGVVRVTTDLQPVSPYTSIQPYILVSAVNSQAYARLAYNTDATKGLRALAVWQDHRNNSHEFYGDIFAQFVFK
jgi:hypothetical protein